MASNSPFNRSFIQARENEAARIEAEIISTTITLLEQCAALNREQNALLPALSLPAEILAMVFEFASHRKNSYGHLATVINNEFWKRSEQNRIQLLSISRVCSVWRRVALNASQLWSNIQLTVFPNHGGKQAALLDYWLSNSGQRRLNVSLIEAKTRQNRFETHPMHTPIIEILVPHAHRLHTFDVFMAEKWAPALTHIGKRASLLTSLVIIRPYETIAIGYVNFFSSAPRLREVKLIRYDLRNVLLPLEQIDTFSAEILNDLDPIDVLRLLPCLRHCTLGYDHDIASFASVSIPVRHDTLRTLKLLSGSDQHLNKILVNLTSPLLSAFALQVGQGTLTSVRSFFARSGCALQVLHLGGADISEGDIILCLEALTMLRELKLENRSNDSGNCAEISKRILDLMNPRKYMIFSEHNASNNGEGGWLLPNLETFHYAGSVKSDPHYLVEFLVDRWNAQKTDQRHSHSTSPGGRLRSVTFYLWGNTHVQFDEGDSVLVRGLLDEGMLVTIYHKKPSQPY